MIEDDQTTNLDPSPPQGGSIRDGSKNWDWRDYYVLLGSDVVSMFPSLEPNMTAEAIRAQIEKSRVSWDNIDIKTLMLYIKLNEEKVPNSKVLNSIKRFLPIRKPKSRRGKKPTIASKKQEENVYGLP